MTSSSQILEQIEYLLNAGEPGEAERLVDEVANGNLEELVSEWNTPQAGVQNLLSICYNNIGMYYLEAVRPPYSSEDTERHMKEAALEGRRCHEKAFDLFDMAAEDVLYLPSGHPLNKSFIFTFLGLGLTNYILENAKESHKYLTLALRIPTDDEQTKRWQTAAGSYLHKLEKKPVTIVLKVEDVMPNMFDPYLVELRGTLLEWDSYVRPEREAFVVRLTEADIDALINRGLETPGNLESHILILQTGDSCDLSQALSIVDIL